jgi:aspartate carbamoyltransferase catalytic subunit
LTLFYEASTRTRLSFESAMKRLGGRVISTENAKEFSSAVKGESLEDTIRVVSTYCDLIVLRYDKEGGAKRAKESSSVPIINAGDGSGQHPTQALLDLYTIKKCFGEIRGLKIAMVGDLLNGRTVRSLSYFLAKHYPDNEIYFISPNRVRMRDDIKEYLDRYKLIWSEVDNFQNILPILDVIYQTRVQKERFEENQLAYEEIVSESEKLIIDRQKVEQMKPSAIIMHPLPRLSEIRYGVDKDPRAKYFEQAENGLYVRMALLKMILVGY